MSVETKIRKIIVDTPDLDCSAAVKKVPCYLYLMYNPAFNAVKIGVSGNPESRLLTLAFESGAEIEILETVKYKTRADAMLDEKRLHIRFNNQRKHVFNQPTEWFDGSIKEECLTIYRNLQVQNSRRRR